jgi:hypothetical protein
MYLKKQTNAILFIVFIIAVAAGITVYFYKFAPKPDQFVLAYLDARYTDTDYLNIAEKAERQKTFLKDELINSDFIFGKFVEEIKYFNEYKYIIEKAEFNIYDVQNLPESTDVFARVYLNVKSENMPGWSQLSFYDLRFILNKDKDGYKIYDVVVLDRKYQIPDTVTGHVHDENCTHDE